MSGSEYLLWSHGQFENITFFPPVPLIIGIMTYDADGDRRCRCCPRGAETADVMMTMAGERGGEATVRRRRGDSKATRQR